MISIVVPVFNEAENVDVLCERLRQEALKWDDDFETIFVNDASTDGTREHVLKQIAQGFPASLVQFSRNFGHQAAITAGLVHAKGDAVVVMDGDLQDPPSVITEFIQQWKNGHDVVYGIRTKRKEGFWLRFSYAAFYNVLSAVGNISIPKDSGDFCLMDRKVVDVLVREMPEQIRFVRGLRAYAGFRQIGVTFERSERIHDTSKYSGKKLIGLAADGIFGFSTLPLRIASYLGLLVALGSFLVGLFFIFHRILDFKIFGYSPADVPGMASLAVGLFFLFGITLTILGIIGEYIGRIYLEVKKRPQYIIEEVINPNSDSIGN
ncbi:MAG: glycosyltransferase [Flavobacteriales bacterium]|nr:glycosyltransferase [Flavobacteriales bacterium]